jgi:TolB protein
VKKGFRNIVLIFIIILLLLLGLFSYPKGKPQVYNVNFSPDGKNLIFSVARKDEEAIYRIRKDGSELTRLSPPNCYDFSPVYSFDGSKIAFCSSSSGQEGEPQNLFIMNADGTGRKKLTTENTSDRSPVFSKKGKEIYFKRSNEFRQYSSMVAPAWHGTDIYSVKIDGSELRRITYGDYYDISSFSFSPDGRNLLMGVRIPDTRPHQFR